MAANININTNIPFGYISSKTLSSDIVNELWDNGESITTRKAYNDWLLEKSEELMEANQDLSLEEAKSEAEYYSQDFFDSFYVDEDIIEGEMEGVRYITSWIGGALNFVILESPFITEKARECSLCVPNAGDLDNMDGDYRCYDVPQDWRNEPENV